MKTQRVLVVDDEPPIVAAMSSFLRASGYEVDCAGSLQEAMTLLSSNNYFGVISDLRLGTESDAGFALLVRARERDRTVRCVLLTAYGSSEAERWSREMGIVLFHKPTPLPEIAAVLQGNGPRLARGA